MTRLPAAVKVAVLGVLAWFSAGLSIWAFGTSSWSRALAIATVVTVMWPALRSDRTEATDA